MLSENSFSTLFLEAPFFFLIKTTETSQNSQKSQNLVTLWFPRRFLEEIEKNRFSRSFQEDLKFPGVSRSVATLINNATNFKCWINNLFINSKAVVRRCSVKKYYYKFSKILCQSIFFNKVALVFSYELDKFLRNTFLYRTPPVATSVACFKKRLWFLWTQIFGKVYSKALKTISKW